MGSGSKSRGAKRKSEPAHVTANRQGAAFEIQRVLYGSKDAPHPKACLNDWTRILYWYVSCGFFRYDEVKETARLVAPTLEIPPDALVTFDRKVDEHARAVFAGALKMRSKVEGRRGHDSGSSQNAAKGRRLSWAREALRRGICPVCGDEKPDDCGHGYGGVRHVQGNDFVQDA